MLFDAVDGLGRNAEEKVDLTQAQGSKSIYGNFANTSRQLAIALYGGRRRADKHSSALLHLPLTLAEAKKRFLELGWKFAIHEVDIHYHRWIDYYESSASLLVGGRELRTYFDGKILDYSDEHDYHTAYSAWVRTAVAGRRRLVTTTAGRIGWVSCSSNKVPDEKQEVQRGDVFAIFPGCSTPILLRPTDEASTFRVVCEAYLQGVMEGAIQELPPSNTFMLQDIWLC